jgi:hypothetical protein
VLLSQQLLLTCCCCCCCCCLQDQAKFLPAQFFKCSKPKHASKAVDSTAAAPAAAPAPGPGPGMGCSGPTDKKACRKSKGCVWCEGSFGPGSCYSEVGGGVCRKNAVTTQVG